MTGPPTDGGASERAKEAATRACATTEQWIQIAADAMHDSALGLDRSVRLGDVVEALRSKCPPTFRGEAEWAADFIVREFSEGDHHGQ